MRLYVNIDHVATLREARQTAEPDPVRAADLAERAGADGITVHLREDRRHIQDADVRALKASVRGVLNLELGAHDEIVRIACRVKPFQATLVPERRQEITTEGGLALRGPDRKVGAVVGRLTDAGIRVSLFIDPDPATIDRAAGLGVAAVELHTGRYAHTWKQSNAALRAQGRDGARQGPRPRGARRPRADVSERPAGRPYPRDRGAEYRALDREQLGVLGTGRGGAADAEVGG